MHYLILRPGAIGDSLLTFPILQALRANNSIHITFVSNPAVLSLAQTWGLADEVADYGNVVWSELFSPRGITTPILHSLLPHIDTAICWLRDRDGVLAQNLKQIGVQHIHLAPGRPSDGSNIHAVDYLARTIGETWERWDMPDRSPGISHLSHAPIAIHPGSGGVHKCWPVQHFATVITALWQDGIPVLLLAGPADTARFADLLARIGTPSNALLLETLENASLLHVAQHLQACRGYLGNDSGITHLAALMGTPTLALFGPSDPTIWRPIGPSVQVLYEPQLETLSPGKVLRAIERFLLHNSQFSL